MQTEKLRQILDPREVLKRGLEEAERRYRKGFVVGALGHLEGIVDYALLLLGDIEHWKSREMSWRIEDEVAQ